MAGKVMTLRRWRYELGDAVPLQMTPDILQVDPRIVGDAVRRGDLTVHTFKTSKKTYRMVRVDDLKSIARRRRNPMTMRDTARALQGWINGFDSPDQLDTLEVIEEADTHSNPAA